MASCNRSCRTCSTVVCPKYFLSCSCYLCLATLTSSGTRECIQRHNHHPSYLLLYIVFLFVRCYLKLGDWKTDLQGYSEASIPQIIQYYASATENDKNCYKVDVTSALCLFYINLFLQMRFVLFCNVFYSTKAKTCSKCSRSRTFVCSIAYPVTLV